MRHGYTTATTTTTTTTTTNTNTTTTTTTNTTTKSTTTHPYEALLSPRGLERECTARRSPGVSVGGKATAGMDWWRVMWSSQASAQSMKACGWSSCSEGGLGAAVVGDGLDWGWGLWWSRVQWQGWVFD